MDPTIEDANEMLVARYPVTVRKRVLWGECDPAGVVYTPRFADYLSLAYGWFVRAILNAEAPTLPQLGLGTPMKALALQFERVLKPEQTFDMSVRIAAIRTRTFDVEVQAFDASGLFFSGRLSPILIEAASFASVPIPAPLRARLADYQTRCGRTSS